MCCGFVGCHLMLDKLQRVAESEKTVNIISACRSYSADLAHYHTELRLRGRGRGLSVRRSKGREASLVVVIIAPPYIDFETPGGARVGRWVVVREALVQLVPPAPVSEGTGGGARLRVLSPLRTHARALSLTHTDTQCDNTSE